MAPGPEAENDRMVEPVQVIPPALKRRVELLMHAPIFRGLPAGDLVRIAQGTTEIRAERGRLLFQKGDPCVGFHIVAYGQVKLSVGTPDGAEKVVEILGPGASFGEAIMFTEKDYFLSASALADSLLLHVGRDTLFAELESDPRLARRMLAGISWRMHMLVKDVEALTLHSAMQRVIGYLARLEDEGGNARVTLPAQKSTVASRLNLTPEYFSRILHELAGEGLLKIEGRDIQILEPGRLRAFGTAA
jgi:CRP/FNR family transcriptional regulator, dissimilatory nitrate respiration regulator